MIALIFDTETTGKWDFKKTLDDPAQPSMVELAWQLVDTETGRIVDVCNRLIELPDGREIPAEVTAIHGVTTDMCRRFGKSVLDTIYLFGDAIEIADVAVAHNFDFDKRIILASLVQCDLVEGTIIHKEMLDQLNQKHFCTMNAATDLIKIPGPYGYKWPKLQELYQFLFNREPQYTAHCALGDVMTTTECLLELNRRGLVNLSSEVKK